MESLAYSRAPWEAPARFSDSEAEAPLSELFADPLAGLSLDITRETRPPLVSHGDDAGGDSPLPLPAPLAPVDDVAVPRTRKITPDRVFSDAEKLAWRMERLEETGERSRAARRASLDFVCAPGLSEEEEAARLSVVGSFLRCSSPLSERDTLELWDYGDGKIGTAGRWRCGSKWACPACTSRLMFGEARRLRSLLEAIIAENVAREKKGEAPLSVLFLTLTAPHYPGEGLREQMQALSTSFSRALHCTSVRKARAKLGFLGSVRCFDHTCSFMPGGLDWHSHLHNMLVLDAGEGLARGSARLEEFLGKLYAAWARRVADYYGDGRETSEKAFSCELVPLEQEGRDALAVADYAAKVIALPGYLTKSSKDRSGEDAEIGAPWRSLAPWDLLDALRGSFSGTHDYAGAWIAYVDGTKGFHRVDWSTGLAARFGLDAEEEKPLGRYVLRPDVAALYDTDVRFAEALRRAVAMSDDAVQDVLASRGLDGDRALVAGDVLPVASDAELALRRYRAESTESREKKFGRADEILEPLRERRARLASLGIEVQPGDYYGGES